MNRRRVFLSAALCGASMTGIGQMAVAQDVVREHVTSHSFSGDGPMTIASGPGMFSFVSASAVEAGKTVTGAPYTAEAVNETTRVLSDGTRIVNRNTTSMARDKEGRTRREVSVGSIGPWANSGTEAPRFVTLTDPVSKEVMVLNLNERTVSKSKFGEAVVYRSESKEGSREQTMEARVHVSGGGVMGGIVGRAPVAALPAMPTVAFRRFDSRNEQKESLGKKMIEGVMAEGKRTTNTIPAGEIGNDRPIVMSEETWYSPDLQMVVYSKTVDPQFGETEYRVTNIRRGDPDANLFKAPADFKTLDVKQGIEMKQLMRKKADTI